MTRPVTVLVVEDEPAILELIAINLKHAGYVPQRAESAEQAAVLLRGALPDAVLLDWMLPGQSGLAFAHSLRADERTRDVPILFLTARADEDDKVAALEAGADDYIVKPFSPRELTARIRAVLRRRAPQRSPVPIELHGLRLEPATRDAYAGGRRLTLSPTEFRLLHFLLTHPDRVHGRSRLLDSVWSRDAVLDARTVDVHIRRLRRALAACGCEDLIETVRGEGYLLRTGSAS